MTTLNNYDQSSTGISLECSVYYDTGISRMDFDDSLQILRHSSYRETCIAYYTDNGNVPNADSVEFTVKGEDQALTKFVNENCGWQAEDFATASRDDMQEAVINELGPKVLNYEELNEYDLKDTGLELVPSKTLVKVITRGYSQGDYAEVYYCPTDLKEAWGNEPQEKDVKETIDHLFWDAPIAGLFTINGNEYSYYEFPGWDEWSFKRDEWPAYVSEKSGVDIELLSEVCPKDPSY